jgi:hypothetical protein
LGAGVPNVRFAHEIESRVLDDSSCSHHLLRAETHRGAEDPFECGDPRLRGNIPKQVRGSAVSINAEGIDYNANGIGETYCQILSFEQVRCASCTTRSRPFPQDVFPRQLISPKILGRLHFNPRPRHSLPFCFIGSPDKQITSVLLTKRSSSLGSGAVRLWVPQDSWGRENELTIIGFAEHDAEFHNTPKRRTPMTSCLS